MYKPAPNKATNFKFVDLSSEGESDEEEEKENFDSRSQFTNQTYSVHQPCTHDGTLFNRESNILNRQSSIVNQITKSGTPLKEMQSSNMSLEQKWAQNSKGPKVDLNSIMKQNQELRKLNKQLENELRSMLETTTSLEQKLCDCQQKIQSYEDEIRELKSKVTNMQTLHSKTVKEYQNKLTNLQLPGNKHWSYEVDKITAEIKEEIQSITVKYLKELTKEKMNSKVEDIITNLINQLNSIHHTHQQHPTDRSPDLSLKFKSNKSQTYRSQRMNQIMTDNPHTNSVISEDYRLLEKSIEKLKNMEKEIEKSSGTYLKRKQQEEFTSINKSIGFQQSSLSDLGRSKSRRKRIFQ